MWRLAPSYLPESFLETAAMSLPPTLFHDALHTPFPLTDLERRRFDTDGFVHLRGVFDPSVVAAYGERITRLTLALEPNREIPVAQRDTYGQAFVQVVNLWLKSHLVRDFVFGQRLARIAAELLGVDGVRLWHDQALHKEPGGGITPWHTDQYYWPMATDRCVTAWVPLQDTPLPMGPLAFAAGSHRITAGRDLPIGDASEQALDAAVRAANCPVVQEPFAAGDVSFHLGWTAHRAGPNTTTTPRGVMTIIYMDAAMRLATPANPNQEADWKAFCPDVQAGAVIDAPMTPVLWSRRAAHEPPLLNTEN